MVAAQLTKLQIWLANYGIKSKNKKKLTVETTPNSWVFMALIGRLGAICLAQNQEWHLIVLPS